MRSAISKNFLASTLKAMQVLDIGCGRNKIPGAIGMDKIALPGVDVVHDLNSFPYPFGDSSFDEIYATHVIEHLDSIVGAMEEIHRLAKPNAKVVIVTPHYSDCSSWNDPTHKWQMTWCATQPLSGNSRGPGQLCRCRADGNYRYVWAGADRRYRARRKFELTGAS